MHKSKRDKSSKKVSKRISKKKVAVTRENCVFNINDLVLNSLYFDGNDVTCTYFFNDL